MGKSKIERVLASIQARSEGRIWIDPRIGALWTAIACFMQMREEGTEPSAAGLIAKLYFAYAYDQE